jgi:hypothetical protein
LNFDDGFGSGEPLTQPLVLLAQSHQFALLGGVRRATPPAGGEGVEDAFLTLPAPGRQMRGVQPFPPQEGADFARRPGRIGLGQDPQLVPDGELPPPCALKLLRHLGVRHHRDRPGRRVAGFEGIVLRHQGLRAFSTLVTNYSIGGVSASIDREGDVEPRRYPKNHQRGT